jgi:hypothetical protein
LFCAFDRIYLEYWTRRYIFKFVFRKEALSELQDFEQQLYFDYFSSPTLYDNSFQTGQQDSQLSVSQSIVNSDLKSDLNQFTNTFPESVKLAIQRKTVDLATEYNQNSIHSLTNLLLI